MTVYDAASNVNAKIAGSKNPKVAAIGAAMQARTAAVRAAQAPVDKLKAFTSSLGSGIKAAQAAGKGPGSQILSRPPAPHMEAFDAAAAGRPATAKPGSAYRALAYQ